MDLESSNLYAKHKTNKEAQKAEKLKNHKDGLQDVQRGPDRDRRASGERDDRGERRVLLRQDVWPEPRVGGRLSGDMPGKIQAKKINLRSSL